MALDQGDSTTRKTREAQR